MANIDVSAHDGVSALSQLRRGLMSALGALASMARSRGDSVTTSPVRRAMIEAAARRNRG